MVWRRSMIGVPNCCFCSGLTTCPIAACSILVPIFVVALVLLLGGSSLTFPSRCRRLRFLRRFLSELVELPRLFSSGRSQSCRVPLGLSRTTGSNAVSGRGSSVASSDDDRSGSVETPGQVTPIWCNLRALKRRARSG